MVVSTWRKPFYLKHSLVSSIQKLIFSGYFCNEKYFWSSQCLKWHSVFMTKIICRHNWSHSSGQRNVKNLSGEVKEGRNQSLCPYKVPVVLLLVFFPWDWGQYAPRMGNELMMIILVISSRSDPQWGLIFHQVTLKLERFGILLLFLYIIISINLGFINNLGHTFLWERKIGADQNQCNFCYLLG